MFCSLCSDFILFWLLVWVPQSKCNHQRVLQSHSLFNWFHLFPHQAGEKHYHPTCARCVRCEQMFAEGEEMYLQGNCINKPHGSVDQHNVVEMFASSIILFLLLFQCVSMLAVDLCSPTPPSLKPCALWIADVGNNSESTSLYLQDLLSGILHADKQPSRRRRVRWVEMTPESWLCIITKTNIKSKFIVFFKICAVRQGIPGVALPDNTF